MGLRKSGYRGETGENLNGVLDLYSFRPTNGGLRLWFTLIGAQQADALLLELQAARREADAGWKIQTVSIADAFTEGARRWGYNFRMRHTAPSAVQGVWGRPIALAWAMAVNASSSKPPAKTKAGLSGGGAAERKEGVPAQPRSRAWEPTASDQTSSSESMGPRGSAPDGRLDALTAEVAGVKSGQARLTQRLDSIQGRQEQADRRLDGLETRQSAESAREAAMVKATLQAFATQSQVLARMASLSVQPRANRRSGAGLVASSKHSSNAMVIEGVKAKAPTGSRRSGKVTRFGDSTGVDVTSLDGDDDDYVSIGASSLEGDDDDDGSEVNREGSNVEARRRKKANSKDGTAEEKDQMNSNP